MENINSSYNEYTVHVFFLNSIVSSTPYGAKLNAGKRLTLQDSNGYSPFATVDNGSIDYTSIESLSLNGDIYYLNQAETAGVVTATVSGTLTAGNQVGFWVWQFDPYNRQPINIPVFTTIVTGDTVTTVAARLAAIVVASSSIGSPVNTSPNGFHFASVTPSAGVITITAATGYPTVSLSGASANVAPAISTAYVTSYGITEGTNNLFGDMSWGRVYTQPFSSYTSYVASNAYDINVFTALDSRNNKHLFYIFVNIGDTNYSNFKTAYLTDILELGAGTPTAALIQPAVASTNQSAVL